MIEISFFTKNKLKGRQFGAVPPSSAFGFQPTVYLIMIHILYSGEEKGKKDPPFPF